MWGGHWLLFTKFWGKNKQKKERKKMIRRENERRKKWKEEK